MRRRIVAASHIIVTTITWLHCLGLLLRVLVVLGLNATLKLICPSSSSSSSSNVAVFYSWYSTAIVWEAMDREWKNIAPLNGGLSAGAGKADQTYSNA